MYTPGTQAYAHRSSDNIQTIYRGVHTAKSLRCACTALGAPPTRIVPNARAIPLPNLPLPWHAACHALDMKQAREPVRKSHYGLPNSLVRSMLAMRLVLAP